METILAIEKVIRWYSDLSRDYNDLDTLLSAARKLSTLLFEFAGEVGGMYKQRNRTEFQRKAEFARIYRELMAGDPRPSVSAAEKEADGLVSTLRNEEQQADAEYQAARLYLEAAKAVHEQMRQHISNLKSEKALEGRGQGSQN